MHGQEAGLPALLSRARRTLLRLTHPSTPFTPPPEPRRPGTPADAASPPRVRLVPLRLAQQDQVLLARAAQSAPAGEQDHAPASGARRAARRTSTMVEARGPAVGTRRGECGTWETQARRRMRDALRSAEGGRYHEICHRGGTNAAQSQVRADLAATFETDRGLPACAKPCGGPRRKARGRARAQTKGTWVGNQAPSFGWSEDQAHCITPRQNHIARQPSRSHRPPSGRWRTPARRGRSG